MKRFVLAGFVVAACFAVIGAVLVFEVRQAEDRRRAVDARYLKEALANYDSLFQRLPRYQRTSGGEPATSWRVDLMPFLYAMKHEWDGEQPWTAEINSYWRGVVHEYYCGETTNARVFAFAKEMTSVDGDVESRRLADLPPEMILFLRTRRDSDIHWMEPRDLTLDEALNEKHCPPGEEVVVTFADGQVWAVTRDAKEALRTFLDPPADLPDDERERRLAPYGRWLNPPWE